MEMNTLLDRSIVVGAHGSLELLTIFAEPSIDDEYHEPSSNSVLILSIVEVRSGSSEVEIHGETAVKRKGSCVQSEERRGEERGR